VEATTSNRRGRCDRFAARGGGGPGLTGPRAVAIRVVTSCTGKGRGEVTHGRQPKISREIEREWGRWPSPSAGDASGGGALALSKNEGMEGGARVLKPEALRWSSRGVALARTVLSSGGRGQQHCSSTACDESTLARRFDRDIGELPSWPAWSNSIPSELFKYFSN
jgi:hypothetical protein